MQCLVAPRPGTASQAEWPAGNSRRHNLIVSSVALTQHSVDIRHAVMSSEVPSARAALVRTRSHVAVCSSDRHEATNAMQGPRTR